MLRSIRDLEGSALEATDGELGKVEDFYFDDDRWLVRYAVVDTRRWLPGRSVLIAPAVLGEPDRENESIPVRLSKDQVKKSPDADTDMPVSRQLEAELARHYDWPAYWGALPTQGLDHNVAVDMAREREAKLRSGEPPGTGDPHLRSAQEVMGYELVANDGKVGVVDDFIADTDTWTLRYLVVDRGGGPAGKVLVSSEWISEVDWGQNRIRTDLDKREIGASPPLPASTAIDRGYEERLHSHYRRRAYWA